MKRGLLKEMANTPTAIVCGWRLYGPDLPRLRALVGEPVVIDLLTGDCSVRGSTLAPPLFIADELARWARERFERDGIPPGTVSRATTTLTAQEQVRTLAVDCSTVVETTRGTYSSRDTARWGLDDFAS
jgi:hypothetical protein